MAFDSSNQYFKTAVSFVNGTAKHVFITGKAGTGKTTFLKYIRDNSFKRMAVVAPTGVAAINAGGVTIHSFFQLPFGAFLPGGAHGWNDFENGINNRESLLRNLRLTGPKREVIKELELLVIDEVSMVRADLLDAIDTVLRHVRRQPHLPFGGVQLVYIGDLYQLPPVTNNTEWDVLKSYYQSPFFFHAKAIEQAPPVYIELKKIYRQTDDVFIDLLNKIRHNCCNDDDLQVLNSYYRPGFTPRKEEGYIMLTSHNARADHINQHELEKTSGVTKKFEAMVKGDFPDKAFPVEKVLHLKEGAQVMFIKNDKGDDRKFYNGKLATIKRFDEDKIIVSFLNDNSELELEHEVWRNIRYHYNKEEDEIEEEELGTFAQYPIRLAWAITIHKSQGLTFDKAIIDAGASFAAGQVYVALSRLTSIDGLVLLSKIRPQSISTDTRIISFAQSEINEHSAKEILEKEQQVYLQHILLKSFYWSGLTERMHQFLQDYDHRQIPDKPACIEWANKLVNAAEELNGVAEKFAQRLRFLFNDHSADQSEHIASRTNDAANYFANEIDRQLLKPAEQHVQEMKLKQKTKKYLRELHDLQMMMLRQQQQVRQAAQLASALTQNIDMSTVLEDMRKVKAITIKEAKQEVVKTKPQKGETARLSLQLFKQGKSITEIAAARSLASSTIFGHLATFVSTGEVDILDLLTAEKLASILPLINDESTPATIRANVGEAFSYNELKAAINFYQFEKLHRAMGA